MDQSILEKRAMIEGSIHKRTPQRPASVPTDIYISNKSKQSAIVKRVRRLMLKENHKSVVIHGLGAMVIRATTMALAAQIALENQVTLRPTTETISLVDDIIPDDMKYKKDKAQ
ncbi:hypothetical protein BD408DRAFT_435529 [Parasitella parasitica]|nr:hypothetical protein BD408DRAFT_435529 [Parasitella parasitica]